MGRSLWDLLFLLLYQVEVMFTGAVVFCNASKKAGRYVIAGSVYVVCILFVNKYASEQMLLFTDILFNIAIYLFLFQGKWSRRLLNFVEVYAMTGMMSSIVESIFSLIMPSRLEYINECAAHLIVICIMITMKIFHKDALKKIAGYLNILSVMQQLGVVLLIFNCTGLIYGSQIIFEMLDSRRLGYVLRIVVILIIIVLVIGIFYFTREIYQKSYYQKQALLIEELMKKQQEYYSLCYEKDQEIRKFRHDIKAQLGCLQLLLSEGKLKQAEKYLGTMEGEFQKGVVRKYRVGNELLDMIINQCAAKIKEQKIDFDVDGNIPGTGSLNVYDMCSIFSNAMNNALEACRKLEVTQRKIGVLLKEHYGDYFFCFSNTATQEMYKNVINCTTSKQDETKHGFGMKNIESAVVRNQGEMEYRFTGEMIVLEIYFYNKN